MASLLFAELAASVKDRKQTVMEYLDDLYIDVGHYGEHLINKVFKGREGLDKIRALMKAFRTAPPRTIAGLAVTEVFDYQTHEIRDLAAREAARPLPEPSGDLLIFHTEEPGIRFAARPSGTEPKIKFYLFARTDVKGPAQLAEAKARPQSGLTGCGRISKNTSRRRFEHCTCGLATLVLLRDCGPWTEKPACPVCRISVVGEDWGPGSSLGDEGTER